LKYDKYYDALEKIGPIFDLEYTLEDFEVSLCDLSGEAQRSAIVLKIREKLEVLFDEYWKLYKPLTLQSGQSSGAKP